MNDILYFKIGIGSSVLYAVLFALGFFNTEVDTNWHNTWAVLLLLTAVCGSECLLILIVLLIRKALGYKEEIDEEIDG